MQVKGCSRPNARVHPERRDETSPSSSRTTSALPTASVPNNHVLPDPGPGSYLDSRGSAPVRPPVGPLSLGTNAKCRCLPRSWVLKRLRKPSAASWPIDGRVACRIQQSSNSRTPGVATRHPGEWAGPHRIRMKVCNGPATTPGHAANHRSIAMSHASPTANRGLLRLSATLPASRAQAESGAVLASATAPCGTIR